MRAGARQVFPTGDLQGTGVQSATLTNHISLMKTMFVRGRIIYKTDLDYLATIINYMIGHYHTFEDGIQGATYGGVYGDDAGYGGGPYPNRGGAYGRGEDAVMGSRATGVRNVNSSTPIQTAGTNISPNLFNGLIEAVVIQAGADICNNLRQHNHNVADAYGNNAWDPNSY